jgi:hypothetical protein
MTPRKEPTLGELMADPLIRAVMAADHVDAGALEAMLHSLAPQAGKRQRPKAILWPQPRFDHVEASYATPSAPAKPAENICGSLCSW